MIDLKKQSEVFQKLAKDKLKDKLFFRDLVNIREGRGVTNEMKLLTALCEALGFEVEIERDYQEAKITYNEFKLFNENIPGMERLRVKSANGIYDIDESGMYTLMLKEPILSYKLVRREE